MTYAPWSARVTGKNPAHIELLHEGTTIFSAVFKGTSARNRAWDQGRIWLSQAQAGLVAPVPFRDLAKRLIARPMQARAPQERDLSALPLFGDQARQIDLMDIA